MPHLRNFILTLGLLFVAVSVQGLIWHWWFETFVLNRIHSIFAGIQLDVLVDQIPTMFSFLLLGTLSFFVIESPRPYLWAVLLGVMGAVFKAVTTQSIFTGLADIGDKINYFAIYLYPPLFALLGNLTVWWWVHRRTTPLTRLPARRRRMQRAFP